MAARAIICQARDTNGSILSGAKLNVYDAGTTTRRDIFTDSGLSTPSANPAIADSDGIIVVYIDDAEGDAKFALTNSAESVTYYSKDNFDPTTGALLIYPLGGDQGLATIDSPTFAGLTLTADLDMSGNDIILDADNDTKIVVNGDDSVSILVGGAEVLKLDGAAADKLILDGVSLKPTGATVGQAWGFPNSSTVLEPYTPAGGGDALKAANETITGNWNFTGALQKGGQDVHYPGGADVAVSDGGTGASTAGAAKDNLRFSVDYISTLTALAKADLTDGELVWVRQYAADRSKGEGVFQWDASATDTAVQGVILAADEGGNGRWFRKYDVLKPEDCGAYGDGSTDDTTPLQAWLNSGGGELDEATYISGDLTADAPFVIRGRGKTKSVIKYADSGGSILLRCNSGASGFVAEHFGLDGNRTTRTGNGESRCVGLSVYDGCDDYTIRHLNVDNIDGKPLQLREATDDCVVEHVYCTNHGGPISMQKIARGTFGNITSDGFDTNENGETEWAMVFANNAEATFTGPLSVRNQTISNIASSDSGAVGQGIHFEKNRNWTGMAHLRVEKPVSRASSAFAVSAVSNQIGSMRIDAGEGYVRGVEFRNRDVEMFGGVIAGDFALSSSKGLEVGPHWQDTAKLLEADEPDPLPQTMRTGGGARIFGTKVYGYGTNIEVSASDTTLSGVQCYGAMKDNILVTKQEGQLFFPDVTVASDIPSNIRIDGCTSMTAGRAGVMLEFGDGVEINGLIAEANGVDVGVADELRAGVACNTADYTASELDLRNVSIRNATSGQRAARSFVDGMSLDGSNSAITVGPDLKRSSASLVNDSAGVNVVLGDIIEYNEGGNQNLTCVGRVIEIRGDDLILRMETLRVAYTGLSGTFTAGETITGGTSGVTATVRDDDGVDGMNATFDGISGFEVGETITGGTSGATATVSVMSAGQGTEINVAGGANWSSDATGLILTNTTANGADTATLEGRYWIEVGGSEWAHVNKVDEDGGTVTITLSEDTPVTASQTGLQLRKSEPNFTRQNRQQHGVVARRSGDIDELFIDGLRGENNITSGMWVNEDNFAAGSEVWLDTINDVSSDANGGIALNTGSTTTSLIVVSRAGFAWQTVRAIITTAIAGTLNITREVQYRGNQILEMGNVALNTKASASIFAEGDKTTANITFETDSNPSAGAVRCEVRGRMAAAPDFANV